MPQVREFDDISAMVCSMVGINRDEFERGADVVLSLASRLRHRKARGSNRFNKREVARAVCAARGAGETIERVEIDPRTGKISVVIAKPGEASGVTDTPERIIENL
jgi:hypothetical protein